MVVAVALRIVPDLEGDVTDGVPGLRPDEDGNECYRGKNQAALALRDRDSPSREYSVTWRCELGVLRLYPCRTEIEEGMLNNQILTPIDPKPGRNSTVHGSNRLFDESEVMRGINFR